MPFCRWQLLTAEAQGFETKRAFLLLAVGIIPLLPFHQKFCHAVLPWNVHEEHSVALHWQLCSVLDFFGFCTSGYPNSYRCGGHPDTLVGM